MHEWVGDALVIVSIPTLLSFSFINCMYIKKKKKEERKEQDKTNQTYTQKQHLSGKAWCNYDWL